MINLIPLLAGLLLVFVLMCATFIVLKSLKLFSKELKAVMLLMFFLHLAVVLCIYLTGFNPFPGGADYVGYNHDAIIIAQRVRSMNFNISDMGLLHYYPLIIGYVYAFSVPDMVVGQMFMIWIAVLCAVFLYFLALELGCSKKGAFWVCVACSLYPSFLYFGSLLLKDGLIVLLVLAGLLLAVKILKKYSGIQFLIFFAILTALMHFRFYIGFALMFSFIISWFLAANQKLFKKVLLGLGLILLIGFSPQIAGLGYYGQQAFKDFLNIGSITNYREKAYVPESYYEPGGSGGPSLSGNDSSFVVSVNSGNKFRFIMNYGTSYVYSFLGPFPWQLKFKKHLMFLFETIPWYFLLIVSFYGICRKIKKTSLAEFLRENKFFLPILIFSAFAFGALSLFINNFGIIARIRMPIFISMFSLLIFTGLPEFFEEKYKYVRNIWGI